MPRAVQRATAADVPYSMSSGCATTQSTRSKDSSGRAGNVMPAILPELFPAGDGRPPPHRTGPGQTTAARHGRKHPGPPGANDGDCGDRFIYQGFTTPPDGTPPVINPCPSTQDQDESLTEPSTRYQASSASATWRLVAALDTCSGPAGSGPGPVRSVV